jgi:PAS domain S-box-containing protein
MTDSRYTQAVTVPDDMAGLRHRAEANLGRLITKTVPSLAPENVEALVHELRVHQVELQLQFEELQCSRQEVEESRDRYRELYESVPVGYVTIDTRGRIYDLNPEGAMLLGVKDKLPLRNFLFFFNNSDADSMALFCRQVVTSQAPGTCELTMRKADGASFIAALKAAPVRVGVGKGERLRVAFQDITRRKEVEEQLRRQQAELETNQTALRELTGKLFTAQEDERKRIARELHDDHCQRVTTLIMEAKLLTKICEKQLPDLVPRFSGMSEKLKALLDDFRTLSHDLFPRNLGEVSLAGPIRDLIREFKGKDGFEINFFERDVPMKIPSSTMTTIFRLLQESLCNVVKHANATHVAVTLAGTGQGGVELVVMDDGIGFDTAPAWDGQKGMGIIGMRERARLVGGTVKIISQPSQGTTIVFSIPLPNLR